MATVNDIDPIGIRTDTEFIQSLKKLIIAADRPSLRELSRRANAMKKGSLPQSTLSDMMRREALPRWALVNAFLSACRVSPEQIDRWRESWQHLAEGESGDEGASDARASAEPAARARGQSLDTDADLITWLGKSLKRPEAFRDQERRGVFKILHTSVVEDREVRQLHGSPIRAGHSVRCALEHTLLKYQTLYYCYANGKDADLLESCSLPNSFRVLIRCLGQIRIIDENLAHRYLSDEDDMYKNDSAFAIASVVLI